jgi:hypothetical protein
MPTGGSLARLLALLPAGAMMRGSLPESVPHDLRAMTPARGAMRRFDACRYGAGFGPSSYGFGAT